MHESRRRCWLSVIGDVEGLRWVLRHDRMAWTVASNRRAASLAPGDGLIIYISRNAFHNPTRDESQLAAVATVLATTKRLRKRLVFAGREFVATTDVRFEWRLPEREGVAIKPLVSGLSFVRKPHAWGQYFRSGLMEIPARDFSILETVVRSRAGAR
jgi:hypothetical protein